jgi:hypothetical protein
MKLFLWVLLGFSVAGIAFWLLVTSGTPPNPVFLFLYFAIVAIAALGGLWMLYTAVRQEKHPLPMILLALFIPYAPLWYYFERIRPGRLSRGDE